MQIPQTRLIQEVPEERGSTYQIWADVIPCVTPHETVCLRFSSVWTGAKDTTARQTKGEFFLDQPALKELMDLLGKYSKS